MEETTNTEVTVTADPKEQPELDPLYRNLVNHCFDLFALFEKSEYRKKKLQEITEARRVYEQIEDKSKNLPFEDASNITLPLTAITIDQTEPRFTAALVGKEPYVQFEMEGMEKKDNTTTVIEDFFNKELKHTVQLVDTTIGISHDLMIDGTVFNIPKYSIKEETIRDFLYDPETGEVIMEQEEQQQLILDNNGNPLLDPMTGQPVTRPMVVSTGSPRMEEKEKITHEGGELERVPFNNMFYPDDAGTVEEWDSCDKIRTINPTYAELWKLRAAPGYQNIGTWLLKQTDGKTTSKEDQKQPQQDTDEVVTGKETIECMECHISYPIYQDEEKQKEDQDDFREEKIIVTIAKNSRMIIRLINQKDVYWKNKATIKRMRLFPEHGRSCGTGMYGKLKSIQKGASDMFNAVIDIAYICMLPWFFYEDRAGINGEIKLEAGKGVKVDSVQGILIPQFTVNPNQYIQFVETFMGLWEKLGSIGDWQIGRTNSEGGKRTATEVMTVIQEGNIRQNYQANITRREFIDTLQMLYDLYYQYMPMDKTFVYQGKPVQIPRKMMQRDFRFTLSGSSETANKMIARKEAEDMLTLFGNDPIVDPVQVRKDVLKAYDKHNPEEYINPGISQLIEALKTNPEIMQIIQQYLQQKALTPQNTEQQAA
jgi:hypothetical protein